MTERDLVDLVDRLAEIDTDEAFDLQWDLQTCGPDELDSLARQAWQLLDGTAR